MAIRQAVISKNKIKFRFGEPYNSEASNVQMGVMERGAYRGALVEASSPADKSFHLVPEDGDSIILHRDSSNGHCTVVREPGNISFDMSDQFTASGGRIPTSVVWFVYMTVDYTINSETTGAFEVDTTIPADAVLLAAIHMAAGSPTISSSDIHLDGANRDKVPRKKGVLVRKRATITPGASDEGFYIDDKVCFLNGAHPSQKVSLRWGASQKFPLTSFSNGMKVDGGDWRQSNVGAVLTAADMDGDGCYQRPWIDFVNNGSSIAIGTTPFIVYYTAYVPFDEWEVEDESVGELSGACAENVLVQATSGAPSSVPGGPLNTFLHNLLSVANERLETRFSASGNNWSLMWRSQDVIDDDVTNDTVSLYVKNGGLMVVWGGFAKRIGGSNYLSRISGGAFPKIRAIASFLTNGTTREYNSGSLGSTPIDLSMSNYNEWDSVKYVGNGGTFTEETNGSVSVNTAKGRTTGFKTTVLEGAPNDTRTKTFELLYDLQTIDVRVYWTRHVTDSYGELFFTYNAVWQDGPSRWRRGNNATTSAFALCVGSNGVRLLSVNSGSSEFSSGWINWGHELEWGKTEDSAHVDCPLNCFNLVGDGYEKMYVAFTIAPSTTTTAVRGAFNYRNRRNSVPSSFTITHLADSALTNVTVATNDRWGGILAGDMPVQSTYFRRSSYTVETWG